MKILSIETSCDDTGVTIMEVTGGIAKASFKVLADSANSQIQIHVPYGGVFPMLAKREHIKNLPILLEQVLKESKLDKKAKPVDAIAVTYGPGLEPALWTGITFAQELGKKWQVPVIPTNHMEGHILSVFAKKKRFIVSKVKTPMLSLLVSGGHTQLIVSKKWMQYEIIGETVDDAVGEAFDKVARMLGLPYPGGPEISRLASTVKNSAYTLPRPMLKSKDFNFSYSGLKTSVLYLTQKIGKLDDTTKAEIAFEFQNAAIECLIHKTKKAIEKYKIKTVLLGGGVACNEHLRKELKKLVGKKVKLLIPEKKFTGDNSLMIGIAGYLNYIKNKKKTPNPASIKATGNLKL
jgi:N6-L-threonylcarbamoyladenine synthase